MTLSDRGPGRTAKPLFIGSIPIAASIYLSQLVLGVYEKDNLVYAGRVGTGFTFKLRSELQKQIDKLSRTTSPLSVVPKDPGLRAARWTEFKCSI